MQVKPDPNRFLEYLSIFISLLALGFSIFTFRYLNLRAGNVEVKFPARVGWVVLQEGELIHGKNSDILVVSFVIQNDGNILRGIESIELSLEELNTNSPKSHKFRAQGQFEKLKDITYFTEASLEGRVGVDESGNPIPDYMYSLVTSISLDRNEYKSVSLLFQSESEDDDFRFKDGQEYKATIDLIPFDQRRKDSTQECFRFDFSSGIPRVLVTSSYLRECQDI